MREDLLQYIWCDGKLTPEALYSTGGDSISIVHPGNLNSLSGPDFLNARLLINSQEWAGNIEIHIRSSDWYVHHHDTDTSYDNVILHVVWDEDCTIFRQDGSAIPALQLKEYVSKSVLDNYHRLFRKQDKKTINCERDVQTVATSLVNHWLDTLFYKRICEKSALVNKLLVETSNDWEKVFFMVLLKSFGLNYNGDSFLSLAAAINFSIVRKIAKKTLQLESVFFGLSGLLNDTNCEDPYFFELQNEYQFLKSKFNLKEDPVFAPDFVKLRPDNFPTVRLSQMASLYGQHPAIFDKVIKSNSVIELRALFQIKASSYWDTHFTFGKPSAQRAKKLSQVFIDLMILNAVLPVKYSYAVNRGEDNSNVLNKIASAIRSEHNGIIRKMEKAGFVSTSAHDSQALLHLYNKYCTKNKCLQCDIGDHLLRGK